MAGKLVTIATFDQAAKARLAQNALTEAGIKATVADETTVAMDWLLSGAVGGVKVQVWDEDAERAVAVLEEVFGEHGEGFAVPVSPEELAAQAAASTGEEVEPDLDRNTAPTESDPDDREAYARRTAFTGILILVFVPFWFFYSIAILATFPVAFYALYLAFNAMFGPGELSGRGRLNIGVGIAAIALALSGFYLFSLSLSR